jgi:hypothetical protein
MTGEWDEQSFNPKRGFLHMFGAMQIYLRETAG